MGRNDTVGRLASRLAPAAARAYTNRIERSYASTYLITAGQLGPTVTWFVDGERTPEAAQGFRAWLGTDWRDRRGVLDLTLGRIARNTSVPADERALAREILDFIAWHQTNDPPRPAEPDEDDAIPFDACGRVRATPWRRPTWQPT